MIIKMTVKDNDYSEILENFAKTILRFRFSEHLNSPDVDPKIQFLAIKRENKFEQLTNPVKRDKLTDDEKKFVIEYIKDAFKVFAVGNSSNSFLLLKQFNVIIKNSFIEKWENDECVYFLTRSNTIITQ